MQVEINTSTRAMIIRDRLSKLIRLRNPLSKPSSIKKLAALLSNFSIHSQELKVLQNKSSLTLFSYRYEKSEGSSKSEELYQPLSRVYFKTDNIILVPCRKVLIMNCKSMAQILCKSKQRTWESKRSRIMN